ncbi:MAG: DUF4258 domain-containing protein [Dehalococcoidia bacterium]
MAIRGGEHRDTAHAADMLQERGVLALAFEQAITAGDLEIIEDYREYDPGDPTLRPCSLIRGVLAGRVFHPVITYPPVPLVITRYWPDSEPHRWDAEFRRRLR